MQTAGVQGKTTTQWVASAVTLLLIGVAVMLFGVVVGRMGLLNDLMRGDAVAADAVAADAVVVSAEAMRFDRSELRVKAGELVTLVLDNQDLFDHSFDVEALDVHVDMPPNGRTDLQFTPMEAGVYEIVCRVPGHREAGMVSRLVVEP